MRTYVAPLVLLVACVFLAANGMGQEAVGPVGPGQPSVVVPDQAAPPLAQQPTPMPTPDPEARGLDLSPDGSLTAGVTFIESGTLKLRSIPGATVSFVQNRRVVAQARTDQDGHFTMQGLTPWNVYSVFVNHPDWFAAFSTFVRPATPAAAGAEKPVAKKTVPERNQLAFATEARLVQSEQGLMGVASGNPVQAVPAGDVAAFMGGQPGPPSEGVAEGEVPMFGAEGFVGGGGGGGYGGGGAGGGGGLLGGGIGGALGAIGLALGAAALAQDDNEEGNVSPFVPEN